MKARLGLIVMIGFLILSCGGKNNSEHDGKINGTYVREYSFKVTNPESGNEIGISTIRDTIFIVQTGISYEISNNKWRLNDYDREGWQNMDHSEDRPMPTVQATFDKTTKSLKTDFSKLLYIDSPKGELYKDKHRDNPYRLVLK